MIYQSGERVQYSYDRKWDSIFGSNFLDSIFEDEVNRTLNYTLIQFQIKFKFKDDFESFLVIDIIVIDAVNLICKL